MKLPETGIEPVRVLPRRILSPVRLPIPPLGLTFFCVVSAAQLIYQTRQSLSTTFFSFFKKSFSTPKKSGENKVYSPLNVYMALAMLAEVTDGECRQQILTLLGSESIDALRTQAASVWNANYSNDGAVTSILANSLWLNEAVDFHQTTMDSLAQNYYASSFRGQMGSEEFDQALRDWINEQTGGLLEAQADGLSMDPETIMALASTIYYRAKWHSEFSEDRTE